MLAAVASGRLIRKAVTETNGIFQVNNRSAKLHIQFNPECWREQFWNGWQGLQAPIPIEHHCLTAPTPRRLHLPACTQLLSAHVKQCPCLSDASLPTKHSPAKMLPLTPSRHSFN